MNLRKLSVLAILALGALLTGCGDDEEAPFAAATQLAGSYTLVSAAGALMPLTKEGGPHLRDSDGSDCKREWAAMVLTLTVAGQFTAVFVDGDDCDASREYRTVETELTGDYEIAGRWIRIPGFPPDDFVGSLENGKLTLWIPGTIPLPLEFERL